MLGWCRWINYIDPLAYSFEALMVNEFHGRNFTCDAFVPNAAVPSYQNVGTLNHACASVGSVLGSPVVNGDDYLNLAFGYSYGHRWRNFGIVIGFMIGFLVTYLAAAELVQARKSKGEVLVFRRGHKPAVFKHHDKEGDAETGGAAVAAAATPAHKAEGGQRQGGRLRPPQADERLPLAGRVLRRQDQERDAPHP